MVDERTLRTRLIRLAHEHPEFRQDLLPLLRKEAAVGSTLLRDIRLKNGTRVPKGTEVTLEWDPENPTVAILKFEGKNSAVKVDPYHLPEYLDGFTRAPSPAHLRSLRDDGEWAPSVTGLPVDAKGWARDGSPSWSLVLASRL